MTGIQQVTAGPNMCPASADHRHYPRPESRRYGRPAGLDVERATCWHCDRSIRRLWHEAEDDERPAGWGHWCTEGSAR